MTIERIKSAFETAKSENRAALVLYIMAGDPSLEVCAQILQALADGGADIIELGFPFSDPTADGVSIQKAGIRALENKVSLKKTLELAANFRKKNQKTALVLMGYANPIEQMGYNEFANNAVNAGIDGAIIVDMPPEEDFELRNKLSENDIALIRLISPVTDDKRLEKVISGISGFVYYVSVTGVTGTKAIKPEDIAKHVEYVKAQSKLPVAIGFGIRSEDAAYATAQIGDGIVIGAALVDTLYEAYENDDDCAKIAFDFAVKMKKAALKATSA